MVCFSALPLKELLQRRCFRPQLGRWDYEPYGIAIRLSVAKRLGIQPVIYGDTKDRALLPAEDQFRFHPIGKTFDWREEREWRSSESVNLAAMNPDDIRVFAEDSPNARVRLQRLSMARNAGGGIQANCNTVAQPTDCRRYKPRKTGIIRAHDGRPSLSAEPSTKVNLLSTDNLVTLNANPGEAHELAPYKSLEAEELNLRIDAVREQLGQSLLILGHHYQQDEVIAHADLRGDSLKLSQMAADSENCKTIVFCGVHFMAETADILANRPEKLSERDGRRVT